MLRFAASPTGDMHIGDLRLALFNYIAASQRGEEFMVRIDDTDKEKFIEAKEKEFLEILALFGMEYSNVVHQSEQLRYHRMMAIQLLQDKKAFNCFCTPAELERKRDVAKKADRPFRYDDACTHLTADQTIDNENPFTIRLHRPQTAVIVDDVTQGELSFSPDETDSFVIMRAEKYPTANFANGVDDMLSDISLVIREQTSMNDTPREVAVRNALGYDKSIAYGHLPSLLNSAGETMNIEDEGFTIKSLLEEGFLPSAICNYLIQLGNTTSQAIFTLEDAVTWFEFKNIASTPSRFEMDALRSINVQHLRNLDDKELSRYVGFADESIGKIAKIYLEKVGTLKELRVKMEAIFAAKEVPQEFAKEAETLRNVIMAAPYFDTFDAFQSYVMKESALEGEALSQPLRYLLTGSTSGPEIAELYVYLKEYLGEIVK